MAQSAQWPDRRSTKYLGKNIPRVDGPQKVTGRAQYTYDVVLPDMLYGMILRCPHASAKVVSIDASAAKAMPGVHAVLTDLGNTARYAGEEIAAVAAETEEIARDALKAIRVEYEVEPFVSNTLRGKDLPDRVGEARAQNRGQDPDTLWSQAAAVVEGEYYVPVREHLSLETHGVVVRWDSENSLTCWCSTQAVHGVADELAAALGIPRQNVKVICEVMGGGFGSKFSPGVEGLTAARLARAARRPVKLMLDRYEEQVATGNGPDAYMRCKAAATVDGRILAIKADLYGTGGYSRRWAIPFPYSTYEVPNFSVRFHGVQTNAGGQRSLRAPGHPQGCFLTETVVDELAVALKQDPLEFRIRNVRGDLWRDQLRLGAERIGWNRRSSLPRDGRYRRGMGCAVCTWGGGGREGSVCEVRVGTDGSVYVGIGTQDLGTGTRTYVAAIVAEVLGLPIERVRADIGKSTLGNSGGSGGSVTTASVSPAVMQAALSARSRLAQTAAAMLGVPAGEVSFSEGRVSAQGKSFSFAEVCAKLPSGGISVTGEFAPELQRSGVGGAQFAEVEVDTWTGRIRVLKVVAVQDCGYYLNKLAAESQVIGGVIQGVGMALLEDRKMDNGTGRQLNPNMETYKVPGTMEIPEIEAILYDTHNQVTGIGEPPVIPTAAAIGNAVYDATGVRIRRLPMTPKRYFDALEGKVL